MPHAAAATATTPTPKPATGHRRALHRPTAPAHAAHDRRPHGPRPRAAAAAALTPTWTPRGPSCRAARGAARRLLGRRHLGLQLGLLGRTQGVSLLCMCVLPVREWSVD